MRSAVVSIIIALSLAVCVPALTVKDTTIGAGTNSLISWMDSKGKLRKVAIIKSGGPLGVSAYMTYYDGATLVTVAGSGTGDAANAGFGGYVHHGSGGSSAETFTQRFVGASMAIFDHKQTVDATLETATYTFLDGNDYFQYAITDNCTAGTGGGDTRTPYCTIDWTAQGLKCQGLEYGAAKYFKQPLQSDLSGTGAWNAWSGPYTFSGTVDIPYAWEWAGGREIGFIQSQTFTQQNAGTPTWSSGIPASGPHMATYWTDASGNATDPIGITDYQMNFYDNYSKITWGQPYGWMNASNSAGALAALKNKWGQFSLSILLDSKADSGVMRVRDENRAIHTAGNVTFAVSTGKITQQGPVGTVNPALQTLAPLGFDHNYRAWWDTAAAGDQATMNLTVSGKPLINPTFRISGMSALPTLVSYNAATLTAGTGYYATFDATHNEVWLTIVGSFAGSNVVGVNMATPVLLPPTAEHQRSLFRVTQMDRGMAALFSFYAPASGEAKLCLFDQAGRLVANVFSGNVSQGVNIATWHSNQNGRALRDGCFVAEYSFQGQRQAALVLH